MRAPCAILTILLAGAGVLAQDGPQQPADRPQSAEEAGIEPRHSDPQGPPLPEARAQPQAEASPPGGPPRFIYTLGQDIEASSVFHIDGGGDATSVVTRTEFDVLWFATRQTRALFQFSNEFAFYDFDMAEGLDSTSEPVGSMNRQNLDVLVNHALDQRWSLVALGGIGLARERNADVSESLIWRAGIGTTYQVAENISLGVSVIATAEQEGSVEIIPLPAITATFELDQRWTLSLGTLRGAQLAYQLNDEMTFELRAGYNERNYRLDDEGFAPEGVFQDKSIDLRLAARWQPAPGLELDAGVGSQLWRRFKISDSNGSRLRRAETDPTLVLFAGVSYRF